MKQANARLDDATYAELERRAKAAHRSVAAELRLILEQALKEEKAAP